MHCSRKHRAEILPIDLMLSDPLTDDCIRPIPVIGQVKLGAQERLFDAPQLECVSRDGLKSSMPLVPAVALAGEPIPGML